MPTYLERFRYYVSESAKFYLPFVVKTLMSLAVDLSKFAADEAAEAGQFVNNVIKFAADRVRYIGQLVSHMNKFAGDRVRDVAQLVQHVGEFVTNAVT